MNSNYFESNLYPLRKKEGGLPNCDLLVFAPPQMKSQSPRLQNLLSRTARNRRVFLVENPIISENEERERISRDDKFIVMTPILRNSLSEEKKNFELRLQLSRFIESEKIQDFNSLYFSPHALAFSRNLYANLCIYDLSGNASSSKETGPDIPALEKELLNIADLVFTESHALYEASRHRHGNMHPLLNGFDPIHFRQARWPNEEPEDQKNIPRKRLGFYGVLDDRVDFQLLEKLAQLRSDWQFVMIGPTAQIKPELLPQHPNIHYLGEKNYENLPSYLGGWDLAILPFARTESTRWLNSAQALELLAAGCPIVSTAAGDAVNPFARLGLIKIAETASQFAARAEEAMMEKIAGGAWLRRVDSFLAQNTWDQTHLRMAELERETSRAKLAAQTLIQRAGMSARNGG